MNIDRFWFYWSALFGIILIRYFFVAGGAYFLSYSALSTLTLPRRLHPKPLLWRSIRYEIKLSTLSAVVFALYAAFIMTVYDAGSTLLYTSIDQYGLWYLGLSFMAVLLLQDTYFYFIHRLAHHPLVFKWLHYGHHFSGNPTPWTSFAFDLPEAIIQGCFFLVIVFIVPLHFATLIAVLMTMTLWAVLSHLGFRLSSSSFFDRWLGQWLIGPMHHSIHHRKHTVHYGLYFTFWDKLLGTQDPQYEKRDR